MDIEAKSGAEQQSPQSDSNQGDSPLMPQSVRGQSDQNSNISGSESLQFSRDMEEEKKEDLIEFPHTAEIGSDEFAEIYAKLSTAVREEQQTKFCLEMDDLLGLTAKNRVLNDEKVDLRVQLAILQARLRQTEATLALKSREEFGLKNEVENLRAKAKKAAQIKLVFSRFFAYFPGSKNGGKRGRNQAQNRAENGQTRKRGKERVDYEIAERFREKGV